MNEEPKRYFRRTKVVDSEELSGELFSTEVHWLAPFREQCFYELPASFPLNTHILHKDGKVIGMDAASAAAVWALQVKPGMDCIDTCCAPGMKLSLIKECTDSAVVGLDVSETRLDVCYKLLRKIGHAGLTSDLYRVDPDWDMSKNIGACTLFEELRMRRKKSKGKKRRKVFESVNPLHRLYDRVLVDTECSHDGSARHVVKHSEPDEFRDGGSTTRGFWHTHVKSSNNRQRYSTEDEMNELIRLQKRLIRNGFGLLKPGGIMVYSTCSLQNRQNQEIVEGFLKEVGDNACPATLPFACLDDRDRVTNLPVVPATRLSSFSCIFDPEISGTSGQYIAVICRVPS